MNGFLHDSQGNRSSKRLFALGCFINAVVLSYTIKDPVMVGVFMTPATVIFTGQMITKT